MSTKLKAATALGIAAVAVPVASVLGQGAGQPAGPGQSSAKSSTVATASVHAVATPATAGVGGPAAKARVRPVQLVYFETKNQNVKAGRSGLVVGPVPKKCNVINGYYFHPGNLNSTAILSMGDSPAGIRKWAFYRDNETGKTVSGIKYGVICAKGTGILAG